MITAPAARSRATTSASRVAGVETALVPYVRQLAGDVDVVFDRDRDAQQRQPLAGIEAALRGLGLLTRGVSQDDAVAAQLRVQPRDPVQIDLEQAPAR